ncbi:MAG TPA: hypothetical protein VGI10_23630 [Polyangiaceae bacterium]
MFRVLASIAVLGIGCSSGNTISVLPIPNVPRNNGASVLRIDVDTTSTHLPLGVSGARLAYRDVDRALEQSLEKALTPELGRLAERHPQKLVLFVELVEAHAEYAHDRLVVELGVRATLRERAGNVHLAQTHAHHAASTTSAPEHGAPAVVECTEAISAALADWLAGIDLH